MIIWFRAGRKHPQGLSKQQVEQVSQLMVLISVFIPSWFATELILSSHELKNSKLKNLAGPHFCLRIS